MKKLDYEIGNAGVRLHIVNEKNVVGVVWAARSAIRGKSCDEIVLDTSVLSNKVFHKIANLLTAHLASMLEKVFTESLVSLNSDLVLFSDDYQEQELNLGYRIELCGPDRNEDILIFARENFSSISANLQKQATRELFPPSTSISDEFALEILKRSESIRQELSDKNLAFPVSIETGGEKHYGITLKGKFDTVTIPPPPNEQIEIRAISDGYRLSRSEIFLFKIDENGNAERKSRAFKPEDVKIFDEIRRVESMMSDESKKPPGERREIILYCKAELIHRQPQNPYYRLLEIRTLL